MDAKQDLTPLRKHDMLKSTGSSLAVFKSAAPCITREPKRHKCSTEAAAAAVLTGPVVEEVAQLTVLKHNVHIHRGGHQLPLDQSARPCRTTIYVRR